MFYETWLEMKNANDPLDQVKMLNSVLFHKLKFGPNTKNFHAPSNSMINVVLESKKGNPISLSCIYMIVAQKLKMPVYGVNLPNLFVLTYKDLDTQFYINAFNRGLIFSRKDIDKYIEQLKTDPKEEYYEPCTNFDIVIRFLKNLVISFDKLGDDSKVRELKELLVDLQTFYIP